MLLNSKLHIDQRDAEVNMNCLLFKNTSCSPKQSQRLFHYIKNVSLKKSVIYSKFRLTFLHKTYDVTSQTMRY